MANCQILQRMAAVFLLVAMCAESRAADMLTWDTLPELPNDLGVAGPFAGVHNDALIVAGGANFPLPVWETAKQWVDDVYVLSGPEGNREWVHAGRLPKPMAYGTSVSTDRGVLCIGGSDADQVFANVFLLSWNGTGLQQAELPALPEPSAYGQAVLLNSTVYLVCGQTGTGLEFATNHVWSMDLSVPDQDLKWVQLKSLPGPERAFNLVAVQHNGFGDALYVIGGRRQIGEQAFGTATPDPAVEVLSDVWELVPSTGIWRRRKDSPVPLMAGTAMGLGQSHVFVTSADTGELYGRADELQDQHPGFSKTTYAFHTITDTWTTAGESPACQVTTTAVLWDGAVIVPSGEVQPRVRSPQILKAKLRPGIGTFGMVNYTVLVVYLLAMVAVGVYFARRSRSTEQYFRGGQNIPWWAAGCSIFATMLSSLTYTGIPSKAYAQDWVYMIGNFMIPVVAVVAVTVAMPFFRRVDATSAYEFLEQRFNRSVRLFGSGSFILFHIFRMAVVMSLTGLALAVATPLTPEQCVLLMGVLSILYCTMGGIEAVIWTDTVQTVVLLGGAVLAMAVLISGIDNGWHGFLTTATAAHKFNAANWHWDPTSSRIALWVVVVGGIAQNLSSYTADQAVVQRYMTTPDARLAARSIWTNAVLTIPSTLLFFSIGTALFAFYQTHPDRLDPTINTDQIFPLFIAREMPVGVAGLLVAGIFAAAQSTVSTSMNSTATAIVTDFLKPFHLCESDGQYLKMARISTLLLGVLGTVLGLVFVNPAIHSLFDQFIKVIGLFMGVLGGLFILGACTRRANSAGAVAGAACGAAVMFALWKWSPVNGYLYTAAGIGSCVLVGYAVSWILPSAVKSFEK
ncbi:MAG: sodium/solute symporter [Planctomycetaceae bacterium]